MPPIITEYPQFFTATNLEWKKLLKPDHTTHNKGRSKFLEDQHRPNIILPKRVSKS
jgi:hypothetical protein